MIPDVKVPKPLLDFLSSHHVATLATVSKDGVAHAATLYAFADEHLTFYFLTKETTGKYKNIQENSNVALVISDEHTLDTVQVEGVATEASELGFAETMAKFIEEYAKQGKWKELPINQIKEGHFKLFKVAPKWIRWTSFKEGENIIRFEHPF